MPIAVGVIETQVFPTVFTAAMVRAVWGTIVEQDGSESGRQFVAVRGPVSELKRAVEAGIAAAGNALLEERKVITHDIVPNPLENIETVLPIHYTEKSEIFRV
ncbi:MAG: BMC domain-containing protein [Cyanobacteria bacterium J06627_8]